MSGRDDAGTDEQLDLLMDRLRRSAAHRDPVPAALLDHATSALELRDLDSELAALVADSFEADERLALVRGPHGARLLSFEAPGVAIELQVTAEGDERRLEGQVAGPGECDLSLEHPGGTLSISPDELGRFRVDRVPAGRLRLRLRAEGRTVTTTWVGV